MSDEQQKEKRPLSMTRRYRRGLVIVGLLCMVVTLAIATVLFQRSYTVRVDKYLSQICDSVAAGYKAQPTHDAVTLANLLPESDTSLRFTLIDGGGTVLYDSEAAAGVVYDKDGKVYAVDAPDLPSHADRPEFIAAMADGSASATRESQTMQEETHYYARRIVTPEGTQVLRVGEDVANIWGLSADTLPLLCGAVAVIHSALSLGERLDEFKRIRRGEASVVVGTVVREAVAKTPFGTIPEIGPVVQAFCASMVSGIMSCTLLLYLDRSKAINKLVQVLNNMHTIETEIGYLRRCTEMFEAYAAELMRVTPEELRSQMQKVEQVVASIHVGMTETALNEVLMNAYRELDIGIPWSGSDFDTFMANPNNKLVFE